MAEQLVDELIDGFVADGRVELMSQFAAPVPIRVIGAILGVDVADVERVRRWSDAFVSSMGVDLDHQGWRDKATAHVETQRFFLAEIQARLEHPDEPTDDLLGELVAATTSGAGADGDEPFTVAEIVNAMQHLLAAGNETTSQAIGLMVRLLVEHPDQLGRRAGRTRVARRTPSRRRSGSSPRPRGSGATAARTPSWAASRSRPGRW